jgi:hypothetical protein
MQTKPFRNRDYFFQGSMGNALAGTVRGLIGESGVIRGSTSPGACMGFGATCGACCTCSVDPLVPPEFADEVVFTLGEQAITAAQSRVMHTVGAELRIITYF